MPNWVFNSLTVSGYEPYVGSVKFQLGQPFTRSHENFNVETGEMETREITFDNPVFSFWNIIKPTDIEEYNKQPNLSNGEGKDWYSWNVNHWGTKWDVAVSNDQQYPETVLVEHSGNLLSYNFNTAWAPPMNAIKILSSQYPELVFELEYEEEQGWGGEITFKNGELTKELNYESKCLECDETDCIVYDEEQEEHKCLKCDWGN